MDIYKKRTAGRIAGLSIPKNVLTDFQQEGLTVQFPPGLDVRDLEAGGNQIVRASELLEGDQAAASKHSCEMHEPSEDLSVASQMRSAERSVVGEPREQQSSCKSAVEEKHAQGPPACNGNTIRVVISKQQLAKLLAEGSIKNANACKVLLPPCALQKDGPLVGNMAQIISNAMTTTRSPTGSPWSPRLDTVEEIPAQLTRSPVITRNSKEVEHLLQTEM